MCDICVAEWRTRVADDYWLYAHMLLRYGDIGAHVVTNASTYGRGLRRSSGMPIVSLKMVSGGGDEYEFFGTDMDSWPPPLVR
jgi:hypothetical protein